MDTPPWDWPTGAGKIFHKILSDDRANESERLIAAELAGILPLSMMSWLVSCLQAITGNAGEPEQLRANAAISPGPILEHADAFEFDDPDDVPISQQTFQTIQDTLT